MRRQFCLTHTVRYDECNCDGVLTPAAFLRYMQGIAARDAEDARLEGNGYWISKRTVISFATPIPIHARLELKTYGIGFTRITAQRGYEAHLVCAPQDEPLVSARTLWVYVDSNGRPVRLPDPFVADVMAIHAFVLLTVQAHALSVKLKEFVSAPAPWLRQGNQGSSKPGRAEGRRLPSSRSISGGGSRNRVATVDARWQIG